MRVFCFTNLGKNYAFGGEFTKTNGEWIATFTSMQTSGFCGHSVLTAQLVDDDENLINSTNINVKIIQSNSLTPFTPSPQFRDEIFDARDETISNAEKAEAERVKAETAREKAEIYSSEARDHASNTFNMKEDVLNMKADAEQSANKAKESEEETAQLEASTRLTAIGVNEALNGLLLGKNAIDFLNLRLPDGRQLKLVATVENNLPNIKWDISDAPDETVFSQIRMKAGERIIILKGAIKNGIPMLEYDFE